MKKVAIVCAAGRQGTCLVNEAVSRGYDVTGFVRGGDKVANPKAKTVVKDLFELTSEDLSGFDVVIDAFGAWTPETLPLHFLAEASTPPGKYTITLTMNYDNSDATTLTSTGIVQVEVVQPMRVELTLPQIPESVSAGDTLPFSFQFMNLGRGSVYNVRCEIDVPGLIPTGAAFAGNMEAGTSITADVNVFIGTKDMSEGSEETEKYGYTTGNITLIYEDENGKEYSEDFEISTNISEPVITTVSDENVQQEEQKKAGQWWIAVAVLGGAIIVAAIVWLLRKRKKNHES